MAEIENRDDIEDDENTKYVLSEWGCLSLTLNDYGINTDRIPSRVGKYIVEDFMELMCKAGYIVKNKLEGEDCV